MEVGGKADVHGIDLGVGERGAGVAVLLDRRKILAFAGTSDVPLDGGKVAGERALIEAANGGHFDARNGAQGLQVSAAHEAESEDGEFHTMSWRQS